MVEKRLYMLRSGTQHCRLHDIKMNQGADTAYEIPVPWFVLTHPDGHAIIDGGLAAEGLSDPRGYWGAAAESYRPEMDPSEGALAQIAKLGLSPKDIRYVVLSHLHADHTGAIGRFSNATHIVQRQEYDYAFAPDWFTAGAYIRRDFDRPGLKWQFLEGDATDMHDLYGDGTIRTIFTPGHSVGHQSFLIHLQESKPLLLAIDAVYTMDHWHERVLPGFMTSAVDSVRSVRKLHALAEQTGATLVPGHDPELWPQFRHAPAYYR